ncbi:MAG TPA: hypothetical protein VLH40_08065 [Atribacteraceae bacterium]|nr:hypothetical protein [Atribacteraceae bacterium]
MDEPTRGIDVGAKFEIRKMVRKMAEGGLTVLYLTSDPLEALEVADRLIIMRKGHVVCVFDHPEKASKAEILAIASGVGDGKGDV